MKGIKRGKMRLSNILLLSAATTASAQLTNPMPSCTISCIVGCFKEIGCAGLDLACGCKTDKLPELLAGLTDCYKASCSPSDATKSESILGEICKSAGFPLGSQSGGGGGSDKNGPPANGAPGGNEPAPVGTSTSSKALGKGAPPEASETSVSTDAAQAGTIPGQEAPSSTSSSRSAPSKTPQATTSYEEDTGGSRASVTSRSSSPSVSPPSGTPTSDPKPGLSNGAVAGITIGACALVALVGILVWMLLRNRKKIQELEKANAGNGDAGVGVGIVDTEAGVEKPKPVIHRRPVGSELGDNQSPKPELEGDQTFKAELDGRPIAVRSPQQRQGLPAVDQGGTGDVAHLGPG